MPFSCNIQVFLQLPCLCYDLYLSNLTLSCADLTEENAAWRRANVTQQPQHHPRFHQHQDHPSSIQNPQPHSWMYIDNTDLISKHCFSSSNTSDHLIIWPGSFLIDQHLHPRQKIWILISRIQGKTVFSVQWCDFMLLLCGVLHEMRPRYYVLRYCDTDVSSLRVFIYRVY